MAYTKQTWASGDKITAEKLNHIEDGIAGAGSGGSSGNGNFILYLSEEYDEDVQDTVWKFDKTYDELSAAILAGKNVFVIEDQGTHDGYGNKYELSWADSGEADFTRIYHNQVDTLIYMNNGTRVAERESTTLVIDTSPSS